MGHDHQGRGLKLLRLKEFIMGYRSNLMVLIYPDVDKREDAPDKYEQLKVLMATTFKEVSEEFGDPYMTWLDADCVLKFAIDDVKWYPSYPDVQMFERMLAAFKGSCDDDEDIKGYCTEFVRIGEETEDVEETHTGDNNNYYLQVRRTIDCNV
jgi:hypothetical protein